MQPVTIKYNQYSNTLWLVQIGLTALVVMLLWFSIKHVMLLLLLPFLLIGWFNNQKTIKTQHAWQFSMRASGKLTITNPLEHDSAEDMEVGAVNYWFLPKLMFLKIAVSGMKSPVYITLFRKDVGAEQFAHILMGITAANTAERQP